MNYPDSRLTTAMIVMFSALIVAACTPAQTTEQTPVPPATTAEVTGHLSGNSASSNTGGAYYAGNGDYKSFYYLPETLSEVPKVCTGNWRARDAKLVVTETCKSVSDGETVSSGPKTTRYAVHIKGTGFLRLDEQREEPGTGKWELRRPVKGFSREAEFNRMQKKIESGQSVMTEAQMRVISVPLFLGYCALVGPFCLMPPL